MVEPWKEKGRKTHQARWRGDPSGYSMGRSLAPNFSFYECVGYFAIILEQLSPKADLFHRIVRKKSPDKIAKPRRVPRIPKWGKRGARLAS